MTGGRRGQREQGGEGPVVRSRGEMRAGGKRISLSWRGNGFEWMKVRKKGAGERLVE